MRSFLFTLILFSCFSMTDVPLYAQGADCGNSVELFDADNNVLRTKPILFLDRGGVKWYMQLQHESDGLQSELKVKASDLSSHYLEEDCAVQFIASDGTESDIIHFLSAPINSGKRDASGLSSSTNSFPMDKTLLTFLQRKDIVRFYFWSFVGGNITRKPYSLTGRAKLNVSINCFFNTLDKKRVISHRRYGEKVNDIRSKMPSKKNQPKATAEKPTKDVAVATVRRNSGGSSSVDTRERELIERRKRNEIELKELDREYERKQKIHKERVGKLKSEENVIVEEHEERKKEFENKLNRMVKKSREEHLSKQRELDEVKLRLAKQVEQSRIDANIKIQEAREQALKAIEQAKESASSVIERAQLQAMEAKTKSNKKIQEIQAEESAKVVEARERATEL